MKKRNLFYLCAMALLAMVATGCSSEDSDENVVQEAVAPKDVSTFFNTCFEKGTNITTLGGFFSRDDYKDVLEGDGTIAPSLVKVRTIHSQKELEASYQGEFALPKIDFYRYVLVVGLTYSPSGRVSLGKVRLLHSLDTNYELQVIMYRNTNNELAYTLGITPILFWRLYPKFPTNNMSVVYRTEEVWNSK